MTPWPPDWWVAVLVWVWTPVIALFAACCWVLEVAWLPAVIGVALWLGWECWTLRGRSP